MNECGVAYARGDGKAKHAADRQDIHAIQLGFCAKGC